MEHELGAADPELVAAFVEEAQEHLQELSQGLAELEAGSDDEDLIHALFRGIHTVKGCARTLGYDAIGALAHSAEGVLDALRSGQMRPEREVLRALHAASDHLADMVEGLQRPDSDDDDPRARELAEHLQRLLARVPDHPPERSAAPAIDDARVAAPDPAPEAAAPPDAPGAGDPLADWPEPGRASSPELVEEFSEEAADQLQALAEALDDLRPGEAPGEALESAFRAVHSLKGNADYVGLAQIRALAHHFEDLLDRLRDGEIALDRGVLDLLLESSDALREMVGSLTSEGEVDRDRTPLMRRLVAAQSGSGTPAAGGAPTAPPPPASPPPEREGGDGPPPGTRPRGTGSRTMRVDQAKLDRCLNLAGELVIARNGLLHALRELQTGGGQIRQLKEVVDRVNRITADIQDNAMSMRMVPLQTVFQRFPRLVRDLSRTLDKEIQLQMTGGEAEVDKQVAEALGDPLVHLVRNAADHGLEPPEERRRVGKSERGTLHLRAGREGNSVVIEVEDDGRGIDVDRVVAKALERGAIDAEAARRLSPSEALELVFSPGLSTAREVSEISGRGVGMDVVRNNIAQLGGSISVSSEPGQGTRFRIQLPLTLAVTTVVVVACGSERYAIPMDAVSETVKVEPAEVRSIHGRRAICLRGEVVAIYRLAELLEGREADGTPDAGIPETDSTGRVPVLIASVGDLRFGLVVDAFLGQQEIVVKPLAGILGHLPGLGGVTIMGDGTLVLVLDPARLPEILAGSRPVRPDGPAFRDAA